MAQRLCDPAQVAFSPDGFQVHDEWWPLPRSGLDEALMFSNQYSDTARERGQINSVSQQPSFAALLSTSILSLDGRTPAARPLLRPMSTPYGCTESETWSQVDHESPPFLSLEASSATSTRVSTIWHQDLTSDPTLFRAIGPAEEVRPGLHQPDLFSSGSSENFDLIHSMLPGQMPNTTTWIEPVQGQDLFDTDLDWGIFDWTQFQDVAAESVHPLLPDLWLPDNLIGVDTYQPVAEYSDSCMPAWPRPISPSDSSPTHPAQIGKIVHDGSVGMPYRVKDREPSTSSAAHSSTRHVDVRNSSKDEFLLEHRARGTSYKDIRALSGFKDAESTLRGRYRMLTKPRAERVRKPQWNVRDVDLLFQAVAQLTRGQNSRLSRISARGGVESRQRTLNKISWKKVAEYMATRGCYRYGNATVKKRYFEEAARQMQTVVED